MTHLLVLHCANPTCLKPIPRASFMLSPSIVTSAIRYGAYCRISIAAAPLWIAIETVKDRFSCQNLLFCARHSDGRACSLDAAESLQNFIFGLFQLLDFSPAHESQSCRKDLEGSVSEQAAEALTKSEQARAPVRWLPGLQSQALACSWPTNLNCSSFLISVKGHSDQKCGRGHG